MAAQGVNRCGLGRPTTVGSRPPPPDAGEDDGGGGGGTAAAADEEVETRSQEGHMVRVVGGVMCM